MASQEFSFRPRLMAQPHSFQLSKDGLDWSIGNHTGRASYPMIQQIRLGYKPTNLANSRFIAEIWTGNSPKLMLQSVSARTPLDVTDHGSEYAEFIRELHRRVGAANPNCIFEAGFPAWRWWPSAMVAVLALFAIGYIAVQGLIAGQYLVAAIIVLTGAWFLWQIKNIVLRNRPRRYAFDAIPEDVLPSRRSRNS